jgi:transcriptional regulator with XRE-family HTH domain
MQINQTVDANAAHLASWREAMGFSQREAAEALGCSRNAFAGWESGEARVPRYIVLACAAVALNIKVEGGADAEADEDH